MSSVPGDDATLGNDSRYRSFIATIDKVLKQFEYSTEWPDLISNLGKVKKAIETHSQFQSIPKLLILTKRLAQCLHPALPSGVHLKALEVYETIFRTIDKRHLQRDLILYTNGLFPLLAVAALPVKPVLITLYETYFLTLDDALYPILTGFLIGLFAALEEGADYSPRVTLLLDSLANRLDQSYFYTCVWSAVHFVASVRHSAVSFVLNHVDKHNSLAEQAHLIGSSSETMVSAVCICLHDNEQPLVQRCTLDFLLVYSPVHKQQLAEVEVQQLIAAMLHLLLKRDASLNRRVFAWFLGTELLPKTDNHEQQTGSDSDTYFLVHTRERLIQCIRSALQTVARSQDAMDNALDSWSGTWTLTKLIRVLLILVDKSDVGPNIIESILMNYLLVVFELAYHPTSQFLSNSGHPENHSSETLKTFNMLLDCLEPYFVWDFLIRSFNVTLTSQAEKKCTVEQLCGITNMLLEIVAPDSFADLLAEHLPDMLCQLVTVLHGSIEGFSPHQIALCTKTVSRIWKQLIPIDPHPRVPIFRRSLSTSQPVSDPVVKQVLSQLLSSVENNGHPPTALPSRKPIDKLNQCYKQFFHQFVVTCLIDTNRMSPNEQFRGICSLLREKTNEQISTSWNRDGEFRLALKDSAGDFSEAFENCCSLLVEFCFGQTPRSSNPQSEHSPGDGGFDDWMIDLCLLSICTTRHFPLQTIALTTLIELLGSALTLQGTEGGMSKHITATRSPFTPEQVSLLLDDMPFFQYITLYLWERLSDDHDQTTHSQASKLLSMLHSMLPNDQCDELIHQQLASVPRQDNEWPMLEQYKRFSQLWNSTRDVPSFNDEYFTKSFSCCLLSTMAMLNATGHYSLKALVEQWTCDCFAHGDINRILDSLLIVFLSLDTARIGIQRVNSLFPKDFSLDASVSSGDSDETNEIICSMTFEQEYPEEHDDEYTNDYETEQEDGDEDKRIGSNGDSHRHGSVSHAKSAPQLIKTPSLLNLSQPIFSSILSLSPPLLVKSPKQRGTTMSSLFRRQPPPSEPNGHAYPTSPLRPTSITINSLFTDSTFPHMDPYFNSIDFHSTHMLVYTQSFDGTRIASVLKILASLIDLLPQQFIHRLLITPYSQLLSNHSHTLFLEHRRSITGDHFDLARENKQDQQSYLSLIVHTLLIYTRSYYPTCFDPIGNRHIHVRSLVLLARTCRDLSFLCLSNSRMINHVNNLLKSAPLQRHVLYLFHRMTFRKTDFQRIFDYPIDFLPNQLTKEVIDLLEEIVLLEHIIYSTDLDLFNQSTVDQTLFLSTILKYLKQIHLLESHRHVLNLVVRILPHSGSALKTISIRVIEQVCRNLCFIAQRDRQETKARLTQLSYFDVTDYIIQLIQHLSYICNYCLGHTPDHAEYFLPTLCPHHWMSKMSINPDDLSDARQLLLYRLPSILSSFLYLWETISHWSTPHVLRIRVRIVDFVASLMKSHGVAFLRAVASCWAERKRPAKHTMFARDYPGEIQALFDILGRIQDYTIDSMIAAMNELIRNQLATSDRRKENSIIWCLTFLLVYFEKQTNFSVACWSTLAVMFKECLVQSVSPAMTFLMIKIWSFYIKQAISLIEKRDLRDVQDITMKVLEKCTTIVASSLEQTRGLRKNLQVRLVQPDTQSLPILIDASNEFDPVLRSVDTSTHNDGSAPTKNVGRLALAILAEHATTLVDIVNNISDEKDRVVLPFLQNLVTNVMPFVRTHVSVNAPSYRSASHLLMNISQCAYTRKAWKKEAFEHLFDPGFFQVDINALRSWKVIIANMINKEKSTSFRDVVNRVNSTQTGLLVSKDQEYEQRTMLLKRFTFAIYASEKDQHNGHSPEILECITDLLKLPQIPVLQAQMFLLFRVLVLRMSNRNLMSFWPIIITELMQVFLQLEQELAAEMGENIKSDSPLPAVNDSTSSASLKVYLYACKLLDILLAIPYADLHHFQFFRQAFVADPDHSKCQTDASIAFSTRLCQRLDQKLRSMPTSIRDQLSVIDPFARPLLRLNAISSTVDLFPFFASLTRMHFQECSPKESVAHGRHSALPRLDPNHSCKTNEIEKGILDDFVESWI